MDLIIEEAARQAGKRGKLTARLRELGGLIRAAGDIAVQAGNDPVEQDHVRQALEKVKSLEEQLMGDPTC